MKEITMIMMMMIMMIIIIIIITIKHPVYKQYSSVENTGRSTGKEL
jgi:competence protein ComGC